MTAKQALSAIPKGLRDPLLSEYNEIIQNFFEHRWKPSELGGGHFCEIVYTILEGYPNKSYAAKPTKPKDFVTACRKLESNTSVPRSFQILIPRILPALYEVRNNRGVGHAGGDVDPNHMDATLVVSICNWIMAELVRVFHSLPINEAKAVVDALAERHIPLVWQDGDIKRVLDPKMKLQDQILLLISGAHGRVPIDQLLVWCECKTKKYFMNLIRKMHDRRLLELSEDGVQILPPGTKEVEKFLLKKTKTAI